MTAIATPHRQLTPAWLDARRDVVGSSDIPVITGNSPYRTSRFSLWALKTRKAEPEAVDDATQEMYDLGHAMEPIIAARWAAKTGRKYRRLHRMLVSRETPWAGASLDYVTGRDILEIKLLLHRRWDTDGPEPVPAYVQDQCQWQMYVKGADAVHVGAMMGWRTEPYVVERSDRYIGDLLYLARDFWDHVEAGEPPEVDGSESTRETLGRMYPRPSLGLMDPTPETTALAMRIRDTVRVAKEADEAEGEAKNVMRLLLGESEGVRDEEAGYRVSWTKNKDYTKHNWEAIAAAYRDLLGQHGIPGTEVIESLHSVKNEGSRVLRVKFRDEETSKWT